MVKQQALDLRAAIRGTWYKPQPVVFIPAEEADTVQSEGGDWKLTVTRGEGQGRPKRVVTLTNVSSGYTTTGSLSRWYSRVDWGNGAVWRKTAEPQHQEVEATVADVFSHEVMLLEEEASKATEACWGSARDCDILCDGACGDIFAGGRDTSGSAARSDSERCGGIVDHAGLLETAVREFKAVFQAPRAPVAQAIGDAAALGGGDAFSVEIVSARGLSLADGETCQLACTCEAKRKAGDTIFSTPAISSGSPAWNYTRRLDGCKEGDTLEFTLVDDCDAVLGKAVLTSDQFLPDGFHGELSLDGAGDGAQAFLAVEVTPEKGLAALFSDAQLQRVLERVREDEGDLVSSVEASALAELQNAANTWLPQAMHGVIGKEWTSILQLLMDETKDTDYKAEHLSAALKDAVLDPLAAALTKAMGGAMGSEGDRLIQLVIQQVLEEIVEMTTSELDAIGMDITVDGGQGQA